jgi:hypothetical protein
MQEHLLGVGWLFHRCRSMILLLTIYLFFKISLGHKWEDSIIIAKMVANSQIESQIATCYCMLYTKVFCLNYSSFTPRNSINHLSLFFMDQLLRK